MATNNFSASVSLNTGNSNKSIRTLTDNVGKLSKALDELDKSIQDSNGNMDSLAESFRQSADATREAVKASQELTQQRQQENDAAGETANAEKQRADAYGQSSKAASDASKATGDAAESSKQAAEGASDFGKAQQDVVGATKAAKDGTDSYSQSLASHRYLMYDVGDTYRTMSVALMAIPAASSAAAIAYENDMAQIQRTTGLAGDAAEDYQRQLKALSTEIPATFSELSEVTKIGGQMGVAEDSLASFTETVVRFTETAQGVNTDQAATAFGRLENMFNVTPTGELADPAFFERIGAAISYTGDNSVTTEAQIISMLEKTTASAKNAGLEVQETIALSSAMASSGLQPFLSSGFIIRFFGNFQKAAAEGGDELKNLASELNLTADEFQNLVRNDPYELLHRVVTQMKDMDSVEGQQFLSRLGINGVQDPKVLNALSENLHVLDSAMDDVNKSYAEASYLDESSAGIFGTTQAQIQMLINSFVNLGATIGSSSLPIFSNLLQAATGLVSGLDDLISRSKLAQIGIGLLLSAMTALGAMAAFRSTLAFVNASLVMFRDAASKGALAGGRFGGVGRQLAEIALLNKGATDQQVQAMMRGRTTSEALKIAFSSQRAELQKLSGMRQIDVGAMSAHAAAQSRTTAQLSASTTTLSAAQVTANRNTQLSIANTAGTMANATAKASGFRTILGGVTSMLGGLLNPAFLVTGAVIGIGSAWYSAKQDADEFSSSVGEQIAQMGDLEGAVDAALKSMSEYEFGWADAFLRGTAGVQDIGKDFLEVAEQAGLTGDQIRTAFEGGKEGIVEFKRELEDVWDAANKGENDLTIDQMDSLNTVINQLEEFINEAEEAEDSQKRLADAGVEAGEGMVEGALGADEMADALDGADQEAQSFSQSLSEALDEVFGFVNAEGAVTQALENMGKGLAESADMSTATSEGVANIENYQRIVSSNLELMNQQIKEGAFNSTEEAANYYEQMFLGLEEQLVGMGVDPEQAAQMTEMALQAMQASLSAEGNELMADLDVDTTGAYESTNELIIDLDEATQGNSFEFHLDADGQPATETTWAVVNYIAEAMGITPEAVLNAIDGTATENTEAVMQYMVAIMQEEYTASLNANPEAGYANVDGFHNYAIDVLNSVTSGIDGAFSDLNSLISASNAAGVSTGSSGFFGNAFGSMQNMVGGVVGKARNAANRVIGKPSTTAGAPSAPSLSAPKVSKPDFGALNKGYNDAAKAARGAGGAGKKAGNQGAKGAKKAGNAAKKAGNAAKGAGSAAKKAGEDGKTAAEKAAEAARDWNKAYQDIQSWAGRVGEALTMAFDQKHAVQSAKDEYYTVLNGINDRLKQQKDRVRELKEETQRLNAERRVELNEASKFERMASIADKHGNTERAKDYRDQAKAMRERAKEMSSSISANKAEQSSIKAGMGNLKGYSQAAIDNRKELRQLEQAALRVPEAYASIGSSAATVANQTRIWTGRVKTHAKQMGYTNTQVKNNTTATSNYIRELKRVPRNIPTVVKATHSGTPAVNRALNNASRGRNSRVSPYTSGVPKVNRTLNNTSRGRNSGMYPYTSGVPGVNRTLNSLARNRVASIIVRVAANSLYNTSRRIANTFRNMSFWNEGGLVSGFASGGMIPGRSPSDPKEDNLMASVDNRGLIAVRSGEYIQSQPAVDYYGQDFMDKVNKQKLPKYWAGGGVGTSGGGGSNDGTVSLSADSLNKLSRMVEQNITLRVGQEKLARTNQEGQKIFNQKRGKF